MGKIKVAHVITRFDKGGSAENTFLTIRNLDKEKYDILLIKGISQESHISRQETAAIETNLAEAEKNGVRIFTVPSLLRRVVPFRDIKAMFFLLGIFLKEKPDIVHTHTSKAGILGRWAAFFAKVPIIIHTPHGHIFWGYFNKWTTYAFMKLERMTALITDRIITLTQQEKNDHVRFNIAQDEKFTVIHSGVDLTKFSKEVDALKMKKILGIPETAFVVGTVGRLTAVKGYTYLLKAAANVVKDRPGTIFVFLGDGELLDQLTAMAYALGIKEHVKFLGWRSDVADIMATFDIFVLPSLNEGMGKVLVEAMAMAKPIIASNIGGIPNIVTHNDSAILVEPANSDVLAQTINYLYNEDIIRKNMGERGKAIAHTFSAYDMIRKIDLLYTKELSSNE